MMADDGPGSELVVPALLTGGRMPLPDSEEVHPDGARVGFELAGGAGTGATAGLSARAQQQEQ